MPVKVSLAGVAINLAVSLSLKDSYGYKALALATTLSSLAQATALVWLLRRRLGPILRTEIFAEFGKIAFCSACMCLLIWGLRNWAPYLGGDSAAATRGELGAQVLVLMGLAAALYLALAHALGLKYLGALLGKRGKLV